MPFHYPCYSRLKSNLGRIDAICGYATLAVDLLSEELQQNNFPRDFLWGNARVRGLVLHGVDEGLLPHRLAQMFIVTVHAQFEEFLHGFLEEHAPSSAWQKRKEGESLSQYVLTNLHLLHQGACAEEREIAEYYRLIRNRFSHVEVNAKRLENQRKQVRNLLKVDGDHRPPKPYDQVDYGDFDLFTRSVKSLAAKICLAARPSNQLLAEVIKSGSFKALRKYARNRTRFENALKQKMLMDFGLDEAEAKPIIQLVVGG